MAHPLDSAYRKIRRARNHLKELQSETRVFVESHAPRYAVQTDDEDIGHVVITDVPKIPAPLSLIVGDVLHNGRSALDHLVYRLATTNNGSGETNAFPIFEEPQKYRENEARMLRDVISTHRTRIEALQPYNIVYTLEPRGIVRTAQANAWLMVFARLDNIDKHRLLLGINGIAPLTSPKFTGVRRVKGRWAGEGRQIFVKEGTELFTIDEIEPIDDPPNVKMKPEPVYTIAFGDAEFTPESFWADRTKGAVTAVDLHDGLDAIERIIGSFADAF